MTGTRVGHVLHDAAVPDGVYIGRAMPRYRLKASIWANPYKIGKGVTREQVMERYRAYILGRPDLLARLPELEGKVLLCWCRRLGETAPVCHGDILVELMTETSERGG